MSALLDIAGLHAGYRDTPIVHGVSAQVGAGEVVCVIGPNGAGKSTLVKAAVGLLRIFSGTIRFDGQDITRLRAEDRAAIGLGYVPQVANVFATLSVRENITLGLPDHRGTAAACEAMLEMFPELRGKLGLAAGRLSGGERQMLAFARCLVRRPRMLLLDEPTAALSPLLAGQIFARIAAIAAGGVAILLVEQNALRALAISHRAYVLVAGRNAAEGPAAELRGRPDIKELYLGGHSRAAPNPETTP